MKSDLKNVPATEFDLMGHVPKHLAVIMDGNSRWAKRERLTRLDGHRAGAEAVRRLIKQCKKFGVEALTLFVFSSENWGRPEHEVRSLFALLVRYLRNELSNLNQEGVCIRFIGDRFMLSKRIQALISRVEDVTAENVEATLVLAVNYGGRWDIAEAARYFAGKVADGSMIPNDITPELFGDQMSLNDLPPPDLCIRTGGDMRLSNFLLWHMAYTELYFSGTLWPDFDEHDLVQAFSDYACRDRRYGTRDNQSDVTRFCDGRAKV